MSGHRRIKRNSRFILLAAVLLFSVGIVWSQAEDQAREGETAPISRQAILAGVSGDVQVRTEGQWRPAADGMTLKEQDQIKTGGDGNVIVVLDRQSGGDRLKVGKESLVSLNLLQQGPKSATATQLDLAFGKVLVHVGKLKESSRFEVKTPTATTGVRGTSFGVLYESKVKTTDLEVYEDGPVLFESRVIKRVGQKPAYVDAGRRLSVPSHRDPRQVPIKLIPRAQLDAALKEILQVQQTPVPSRVKVNGVYEGVPDGK